MRELGRLLENEARSVNLAPDALERLLRRRDHRGRVERIAAITFVLVMTVALIGAAMLIARDPFGPEPADRTLTPTTAPDLRALWHGSADGDAAGRPAVLDGVVVTATRDGHVSAFAEGCATDGSTCTPIWTAVVDPLWVIQDSNDRDITWWPSAPGEPNGPVDTGAFAASDGVFYVQSKDGAVTAFPSTCRTDGGACSPSWVGRAAVGAGGPLAGGLPIVGGGNVYVVTRAGTTAFAVGCANDGSRCEPRWRTSDAVQRVQDGHVYAMAMGSPSRGQAAELDPRTGDRIWQSAVGPCCGQYGGPVRFGDAVYVNFGKELDVFPVDCRSTCEPTWVAPLSDPFVDGPVVIGGAVVLTVATDSNTSGLLAFPVDCATGGAVCASVHRTDVPAELTTWPPVAANDLVYAVSRRASGIYAFEPSCLLRQDECPPAWISSPSSPAQALVVDGLVIVSDEAGGVFAWDAHCDQDPCPPLWKSEQVPVGRPTVDGDRVFFTDVAGTVWAFGPRPSSTGTPEAIPSPHPWLFYGAVALVVAVLGGTRLRRRRRAPLR